MIDRVKQVVDRLAAVTRIEACSQGRVLAQATGFFYSRAGEFFLVTNRHVVVGDSPTYRPETLTLRLHLDRDDLARNESYTLALYRDGQPMWREHPIHGSAVDVIAVELRREEIERRFYVTSFTVNDLPPDELLLPIGDDLLVLGYPLGFHDDVNNLPIARRASVASVYPIPFRGSHFFLTDARMHEGTSGAPVLTRPTQMLPLRGGGLGFTDEVKTFLVGVHSAARPEREPMTDDPLGLNCIWFASLIEDVVK
jgi:hypothetical protein